MAIVTHIFRLGEPMGEGKISITVDDHQLADAAVRRALDHVFKAIAPPRLERFFCRKRIVRKLCQKRIAACRLNRRRQFVANLTGEQARPNEPEVYCLLPPRRHWTRPRPEHRRKQGRDQPKQIADALAKQVLAILDDPTKTFGWKSRLQAFIGRIQRRALNWSSSDTLACQAFVPIPKGQPGNDQKYRIVAIYSLENSLLSGGFASYLSNIIDRLLIDGSLAFRSARASLGRPPNHHDAIELLEEFRHDAGAASIWCSECDIQGFFDAVCHDTVRRTLDDILARLGHGVDQRLLDIIESFLSGYTYAEDAVPAARKVLAAKKVMRPVFADPLKGCDKSGVKRPPGRFGIPQGSALSCVLANVVLALADARCEHLREQLEQRTGIRARYIRYCDDIIIMSTDRDATQQLLDTYLTALAELRLPFHPPKASPYEGTNRTYGPKFWDGKSKLPYLWHARRIPWLAFVGYHLHRDGRIRVRKKSIEKERQKQNQVVTDILFRIQKQIDTATAKGEVHELQHRMEIMRHRMQLHLLSIGAGTPQPRRPQVDPSGVSWVRGFQALIEREVDEQWLRDLDRNRTAALCRLSATLGRWWRDGAFSEPPKPKRMPKPKPASGDSTTATKGASKPPDDFVIKHPGPNFSYARLLADHGRLK